MAACESMDVAAEAKHEVPDKRTSLRVLERRERMLSQIKPEISREVEKEEHVGNEEDRAKEEEIGLRQEKPEGAPESDSGGRASWQQERDQSDAVPFMLESSEAKLMKNAARRDQTAASAAPEPDTLQDEAGPEEQSALKRCEARIKRLDRLNQSR
eukprot:195980-Hanusia_phi.AAC.1